MFVAALLFDLDGTLIDSKRDIAFSVHHVQDRLGFPQSDEQTIGTFIGDGVGKLMERSLPGATEAQIVQGIELFKDFYREHCLDNTFLYPGVKETLKHFRRKKMAVVTNKPERISKRILAGIGLADYFPVVLGGDSTERKKPHPDPILKALKELSVPGTSPSVIIGDSHNDVLAGRAAQVKTCAIPSNIGDVQKLKESGPEFWVDHFCDLPKWFE